MKKLIAVAALLVCTQPLAQGTAAGVGVIAGSNAASFGGARVQLVGPGTVEGFTITARNEGTASASGATAPTPTGTSTAQNVTTVTTPTIVLPTGGRAAVFGLAAGNNFAAVGAISLVTTAGAPPVLPVLLPTPPILTLLPILP